MVKFITSKDFIGTKIEKSLASHNDLEKGGEGSRGGKVIGHTKSGKPVYASGEKQKDFTKDDHHDAFQIHAKISDDHREKKKVYGDLDKKEKEDIRKKHFDISREHSVSRDSIAKKENPDKEVHEFEDLDGSKRYAKYGKTTTEWSNKEPETSIPFRVGKVQDHHEAADTLEEFGHKIDRKNMIANKHGDTIFHDEKGRKAGVMTTNKVLSVHHYDDLTKGDYSELEVDKDLLLEPFVEKLEKSLEVGDINLGQFLKSIDELDSLKES